MAKSPISETSSTNEVKKADTSVQVERLALCPAHRGRRAGSHSSEALRGYLKNHLQLDGSAKGKTCNAVDEPGRILVFSKDVLQQL